MKTLLILRHAKSARDTGAADHDRPLNLRGRRDAPRMGQLLRERDLLPDLIISSTATRAQETTKLVVEAAAYAGPIEFTHDLYHAEPGEIIEVLRVVDDSVSRLMIVGHNPGLEDFLEKIAGRFEKLPTAALARVRLRIERWNDAALVATGRIDGVHRPKEEFGE